MSAQSTQILFIDARVSDVDSLLAHVDPSLEVVRLDAAQDGLLQIAQALAGRSGIEALHIVSHGEPGRLVLGSGVVDVASLEAAGAELASIRDALTEQADLLLYGCNVGEGEFGAAFLGALAGATGADVAASVDTTGAAWLGGDWSLEVSTGTIEATALEAPGYEDAMAVTSTVTVTSGPSSSPLPFASRVVNIGFNYGGFGDTQPLAEAKDYYDRDPSHYSTRTVSSITAGNVSGLDLLFVFQPANAFTSAQIQVFRDFLTAGGRIFFIGEHNYYAPVPNANISAAIAALGGNISVVTEALSDSLHDNGGDGYKELSNSPLMAGVTSFRTAAFAPLSVETTISKAVMVNDTGRVVIADQALLNGRVTVIADQNWLDDSFRIAGNETFLRNLAADSAGMVETQAQGLPPPPVEPVSNAAPTLTTFAAAVGTVQEEGTVQITLADLKAQGNESDDNGVESFVVKAVTSGTLKIGTSLATATAWVPGSNDVVSGSLNAYWTPAENANGSLNAFTVVARDAAGLTSSPAVQVPVSVTPVNDAPTLASNASLNSISEDQPSDANPGSTVQALFAPRFADVDAGQTLGGIIVTGNSADAVTQGSWQYYSAGQWHDIGSVGSASGLALSASTAIRFAPVANYNGTPPGLTVHGTDSAYAGGYTSGASRVTFDTTSDAVTSGVTVASRSLGVTVTAVNDAPVFTSAAGAATIVDTPADDSGLTASSGSLTGTLTASDVESDASALSFSLRGGSLTGSTWTITGLYGTLTVDAVTGAWAYSPDNETAINALPAGASVVDRFDFKVADPQGAASTQALEITLTGSNDMPQLAAAIADQNFSGAGSWSYQVPAGSITDAEGTGLTYSAELADGSPLPGWLNFDPATRTFSGNPPAAWGDAPLSIRVIAEDDLGETVDDTFDLTLSGTDNQPPVVANPLTWKAVDGVNEITEVVFTGALGGQTVAFDGSGPITLGTAATGAEVATALDAAFDAAVGANYSADIKAGVGNENVLVLTADAAGARSEFSDGATVSIDGGSYDVAVVTEGVTAVAEAVSVRFVAPPAGATELVFDGVTVSLVGLSSASDVAAAVAAALNASGARTWNAEVDGTETDLLHFTSVAVGDRADLGTADFEVVATTTPELASAVSVTQAGSAGVPTEATVYIWPEASERRIAFDGVEVILTGGNTSIQNADAFAATTFPNWTVVHDSGTGHLTFTAKTIDPPLAELANESFTTTDEFGTPTGGLAQVQASTPGEAPAPEVVEVTFTAKPDGVSSLVFDGVTIDLAAASTSQEVAQAVADALNAAPGTATWTASAALGVLTLTADASEARTDLTASDFSATAVNQPSLASSVVVTDGVDEVTEVVELTFTGSYGGATVTLDGVSGSAGSAVTADDVAAAVAGATFTHHTAVASGDTVTFTANDPGDQTDIASGDFTGSYSGTATPSVTTQGAGWSYAIPANTFSDPEGDTLTYSAYILDPMTGDATLLVDSAALSFDEATATLSGDGQVPAGTLIEIRAHDAVSGGTAASQFQLVVYRDAQAASLVAGVVPTTVAFVDGEGSGAWTLPSTAFSYLDDEAGDISYAATLSNGEPLPDWLSFDPATGTFSGNPPAGSDDVEVVVTATAAGGGLSATTPAFTLVVDNANDPLVLSHPVADAQASAGGAIGLTFTKPFTDPDGAADGTAVQTGITYTATANGRPLSDFGLALGQSGGNLTLDGNVPGGTPYLVIEITGTEDNGGSTATTSFTLNLADSAASGDNVAALSANNVGSVTLANQSRPGFAPQQGDTLIVDDVADTDGVDAGTLQYQWQVSSDGVTWTDVAGARGQAQTLTLAQSEVGLQVRAQAFYLDNGGVSESPVSTAMPAVADTADAGSVAFTGALVPGESLSAVITDADGLSGATPTYVWQRSANGVDGWTTIGGATYSSYTLGNDDGGKYLRVLTSYTDDGGFVETNVTSAVRGPVQLGAVAPVGNDDSATVTENSGVGNATAGSPASPVSGNLVGNDTDSNVGDTKTVTGVRLGDFEGVGVAATDGGATLTLQGLYGTLAVTKATGAYTYTLNQSSPDVQRLHVGDTLVEKFNYTVTDSALLSDTAVLSITIQGANDLPRITAGIEATATVVEDAATALPLDFLDVEEWDSNIVQLRLTVDHGTLRAESGGGVTVAGSDTGVLILSATDAGTLSSWLFQNDVSYVTDPNLNGAVATLSYEAGDEAGYVAASGTTALTATATNDAPIVDAGGAGSAGNDAAVTFRPRGDAVSVAPALTLSDIDSSTLASATVTLASGARDNQFGTFYETLGLSATGQTLADAAGLSVASTPSSSGAVLTLTGSASLAEYQAVLREVLYHNGNPNAFSADRTVTISVTDGAGALSNTASFETTAVNTDIAVGQRIFVDGVDSGHLVAQVLDSRHFVASGELADLAAGAVLTFRDDGGLVTTATAQGPLVATTTVHVPWTPVIDMNGGGAGRDRTIGYTEGQGAVAIATADASITDQGGLIRSLTVTLTNPLDNGHGPVHETLSAPSVTVMGWLAARSITASGNGSGANGLTNATEIVFTASGAGSDATNFQVALRGVTYTNTSQNPDPTQRVVHVASIDVDGNTGVDADTFINPTSVNDAPEGVDSAVTAVEDTAYVFAATDFGFGDPTDDADGAPDALASVLLSSLPASGVLYLDGVAVTAGQEVSVADITAGRLTYVPADDANGAAAASFTFQVRDDGGVTDGGVDLDATPATMTLHITATNDAPVLSADGADLAEIDENAVANAGQTVAALLGTIADVDVTTGAHAASNGVRTGMAVYAVDDGGVSGTWQYSLDGGDTWAAIGLTADHALLLRSTDLVRFVPDAVGGTTANDLAKPSLSYYAWDQSVGTAGTLVDATQRGGTTALSQDGD
ncbi:MAG: DUF4347 domain-containing protein, partial [Burkholderiaceae bacterium]|nr:DUF4347 domain-containing protein [Burkholderiaceae bacterium]